MSDQPIICDCGHKGLHASDWDCVRWLYKENSSLREQLNHNTMARRAAASEDQKENDQLREQLVAFQFTTQGMNLSEIKQLTTKLAIATEALRSIRGPMELIAKDALAKIGGKL